MKVLRWLGDYWYIPLILIGGVLATIVFFGRKKFDGATFTKRLGIELGAIEAKREARDVRLQLGAEQAKQHVLDKYAEKRKSLDEKTEARVKELEDDPEALAKALERLTRK
jgi:hypothetical protein